MQLNHTILEAINGVQIQGHVPPRYQWDAVPAAAARGGFTHLLGTNSRRLEVITSEIQIDIAAGIVPVEIRVSVAIDVMPVVVPGVVVWPVARSSVHPEPPVGRIRVGVFHASIL